MRNLQDLWQAVHDGAVKRIRPKTMGRDFFDLQVNGYGGVDFNQNHLKPSDLHAACVRLAVDGVGGILATFTTDSLGRMVARMRNLVAARERDPLARQIIAGIHLEGPFINPSPGFRGAHPADAVRTASLDAMKRLLEAAGGLVRLVTLAPECDKGLRLARMLVRRNIVVAAGHCDPSLDQLRAAIDAGLTMFTHLGNGCPPVLPRHENIIQRVLSLHDRLWLTFIADGVHVPFPALGNYLRAAGMDRSIVVTDAVTPGGLGPGLYRHGRFRIRVGNDGVARKMNGALIGGAISMRRSAENLVGQLGLTARQARLLTVTNPRRAIGLA